MAVSDDAADSIREATGISELIVARSRLIESRDSNAATMRDGLARLFTDWLVQRASDLGVDPDSGFALVAVGGLGRHEMLPHSDLDLILLHDNADNGEVARVADGFWYPLWDAHVGLDHSVRTVSQALHVAAEDLNAALGLLEARHIAGDESLSTLLRSGARRQWRTDIDRRFTELVDHAQARWQRSGDIAHRAEPDMKNGRGGLRDAQLLGALAIAQVTDAMASSHPGSGSDDVRAAYARLLDVRTELHRLARRPREALRAQDADEIGAALHLGDRFDLARTLSDSSRTISYAVDVGIRTAANALPRRGLARLRRAPVRRSLDEGVVEHAGEVVLARNAIPSNDPGLILRVASASARTGLPMGASTLARLHSHAPDMPTPWPADVVNDLLVLLGTGHHMVDAIEALDRTGLWRKLFSEWDVVRDLPPRDAIHTWTVDRHLVETAAYASTMTTRVSRPDLLVLGALIHDIGKGRDGDHSLVGAELARDIGVRIGLWPDDIALLVSMVRHHLLLPSTASRRDPDDPATTAFIVETIGGNRELLELLAALTEADSLATGPGVWGDWKAKLIGDLVRKGLRAIDGETLYRPDPLIDELRERASEGGVRVMLQPEHGSHAVTVTAVAPDRPGLLSDMAGVLALNGLRCQSAAVQSVDGSAVNTFRALPAFGDPPDVALLRQHIRQAQDGSLDVQKRLAAREASSPIPVVSGASDKSVAAVPALYAMAPPRLLWVDCIAGADDITTIELRAGDRVGLLSRVAAAIEQCGVDIVWARVTTMGATVVDTFGVATPKNAELDRGAVEAAILAVVPPTAPAYTVAEDAKAGVPSI